VSELILEFISEALNNKMKQTSEKLIGVVLNGKNYHSWAKQITSALTGIDKLEYVTGEMTPPVPTVEEIKELREWIKCNHLVANWLLNTMELHIADIISLHNIAQEIWEKDESCTSRNEIMPKSTNYNNNSS
jgi:TPP-dependent indolepyruvate ferredoxin oxidoreductase alpha subunit